MTSPDTPATTPADTPKRQSAGASWRTAIGAALCMIAASVPLSGLSFFHPYQFAVMGGPGGAAQSEILLYFTLLMLAIVVSMSLIGKVLLPKTGAKPLMLAGAVIVAAALFLFSRAETPMGLYVAGIMLGLGYGFSFQLIPMVWVNNWFIAHKGLVVGIVTGGTGIGGALWAILVPAMGGTPAPGNTAFRAAYLVLAGVVLVLTAIGTLVLARHDKPADVGLEPLGAEQAMGGDDETRVSGYTYSQAVRSPWLWTLVASIVLLGIIHGSAQIITPYVSMRVTAEPPMGMGEAAAYYSTVMSIWTLGLIAMKTLLGWMNDKIGLIPAMAIALALQAGFFVFLPHYHQVGAIIPMVAMLFMSAGMATGTVQPPLLTGKALGNRDFSRIYSLTGASYIFGMAVGAPIWGLFYDPQTRSYDLGFQLAPVAAAIVVVLAWIATNRGPMDFHRKIVRKDDPTHPATSILETINAPSGRGSRIQALGGRRAGAEAPPTIEH
ncbi:MFS transporter [Micrococcus sp.]|uniref:MFS transporter n=1 Tax=Micrococcus sp. TaxID=1271 RepID=UPI0026DD37C9|nr:MFS transporter [Micrococcus sp.]MDO4239837.1 MFS transporter [Micrococcus sp.]